MKNNKILSDINSPNDLKKIDINELDFLSFEIAEYIKNVVKNI